MIAGQPKCGTQICLGDGCGPYRSHDGSQVGVVGAVGVEMLKQHTTARADHERTANLFHALAGLLDVIAAL
jgi:hypothetical protein